MGPSFSIELKVDAHKTRTRCSRAWKCCTVVWGERACDCRHTAAARASLTPDGLCSFGRYTPKCPGHVRIIPPGTIELGVPPDPFAALHRSLQEEVLN